MRKKYWLWVLMLFVILFGCNTEQDQNVCESNDDCTDGKICENGYCVDDDTTKEDGDVEGSGKNNTDGDTELADGEINDAAPMPLIEVEEEAQHPVPLDKIVINACGSGYNISSDRRPLLYWWEWGAEGKPLNATDSVLIASSADFGDPESIMGKWTSECSPKIYFPISGTYSFKVKVRDANGVESGPSTECPGCIEWYNFAIDVKPANKLHIELTWDRGDDTDVDMFLVKYRTDGSFAMYSLGSDLNVIKPISTVMHSCNTDADCFNGAFACTDGNCVNTCTSDADCTAVALGWYCDTNVNQCISGDYIDCDLDTDCPDDTFCNPVNISFSDFRTVCTRYDFASGHDTCSYINKRPVWGDYSAMQQDECSGNSSCNIDGRSDFSCESGSCDYSCETNNQCLAFGINHICSDDQNPVCLVNELENDASLDIDDVSGWGPENISVKNPDSGLYRIVARLYADQQGILEEDYFGNDVTAAVQVYVNGDPVFVKPLKLAFTETSTIWKVADVLWDANLGEEGDAEVVPLCAGWTKQECENDNQCQEWYSDDYLCQEKIWETKYCTSCTENDPLDECNFTIACNSNADCLGESNNHNCITPRAKYCNCTTAASNESCLEQPYANPCNNKLTLATSPVVEDIKGSIWCDSASQTSREVPNTATPGSTASTYETVNILSGGAACSTLYTAK